jgi:hypothetical protein
MDENQIKATHSHLRENLGSYLLETKKNIIEYKISRDLANTMLRHRASFWKNKMESNYELFRVSANPARGAFMSKERFFEMLEVVHNEILNEFEQ